MPLLSSAKPESIAARASRIMSGYVDMRIREASYNRGAMIDKFNRAAGVPLRSSWCMSIIVSAYDSAARSMGVKSPLLRTGAVWAQLRYAKNIGSGLIVIPLRGGAPYIGEPGDVLCAVRKGGSIADIGRSFLGHAAMCRYTKGATVYTSEGNTASGNAGSQADGDGAFHRKRLARYFIAAIRALPLNI